MSDPRAALAVIRREHVALVAVLRSLSTLVGDAHRRGRDPDFAVLRAMLFYVDEFPEHLHHVKESTMLFARLRELAPQRCRVLDPLDRDHAQGGARIRALSHALTAWELLGEPRREAFKRALGAYVDFHLEHIRVEETVALPLAVELLGDADWQMLARAFGLHRDALAGAEPEALYAGLFERLVEAMPPALRPVAAGPAAAGPP